MKLADKHEALKNIGEFVRRVEHHLIFLWIDANKRDPGGNLIKIL